MHVHLARKSKPRLLFVDDEKRVLNSMRAMFRRDYELFLTTRGDEAIRIVNEHSIDVVVADQRMPIMSGVEVLTAVKQRSPGTVRILLTGYSDLDAIEGAMNDGEVFRFLSKPCAATELRGTISQAAAIARDTGQVARDAATEDERGHTQEVLQLSAQAVVPNLQHVVEKANASGATPINGVKPANAPAAPTNGTSPSPAPRATAIEQPDEDDSVEIVMSGDSFTVHDPSQPARPVTKPPVSAVPTLQPVDVPTLRPPSRVLCVGKGKYNIAIMVFTQDDQFARSIGRSLQGLFYTFHATNAVRLIEGVAGVGPAVVITDVSTEPEIIQNLTGLLKDKLPALVTVVAGKHRDAEVMINLINHGQVFRFIDKPLSSAACQKHVREALRRHIQLRKNPQLAQRYVVRETDGLGGKLARIGDRIAGSLNRVKRLWGTEH